LGGRSITNTAQELQPRIEWQAAAFAAERNAMSRESTMGSRARWNWVGLFIGIFLSVFILVVLTTTIATFILPEAFASTARIKVESFTTKVAQDGTATQIGPGAYNPQEIQSTLALLQSEVILDRVIDVLDLNIAWQAKYGAPQRLRTSESRVFLQHMIEPRATRNTSVIAITAYSDDKAEAAKIANTIAEVYQSYEREKHEKALAGSLDQYRKLKDQLKNELADKTSDPATVDSKITETIARAGELYATMNAATPGQRVEIIDHAQPGFRPVRPNKPLNIAMGIVVGTAAGFVIAGAVVFFGVQMRHTPTPKPPPTPA
jgi:uncharacterized protein involved in exopolysaccharide biosynthesis